NLCIDSDDPYRPNVTVPLEMTVIPRVVGVDLSADDAASAAPGETVTYTVQITNTGNATDTFDLSAAGNGWTTTFSESDVTLGAGVSASFSVVVNIPGA